MKTLYFRLHIWTFLTESAIIIFHCSRRPWGWSCRDRNMKEARRKVTNDCWRLCSCWITCCLVMLSSYVFRYFMNDSEMVPVAIIFTGIPVVFAFHMHSVSVVRYLNCKHFAIWYTGCFTTLRHNCRRWFPRSLWWKKFI